MSTKKLTLAAADRDAVADLLAVTSRHLTEVRDRFPGGTAVARARVLVELTKLADKAAGLAGLLPERPAE